MHKIGLLADHHRLVKFSKPDRMYTKDVQPEIQYLVHNALDVFERERRSSIFAGPRELPPRRSSVRIGGPLLPTSIGMDKSGIKPAMTSLSITNPAANDWEKQREMNPAEGATTAAEAWARETIAILHYNQDRHQIDNIEVSSLNTCTWILENASFRNWKDEDTDSILFVRGGPGVGKSVLAKYLVHEIQKDCKGNERHERPLKVAQDCKSIVVSFFARSAESIAIDNSPKAILMHILSQIYEEEPSPCFNAIVKSHNKFNDSRNLDFYWALFNDVRKVLSSSLYCIIDGLDESIQAYKPPQQRTSDAKMEKFLTRLCDLASTGDSAGSVARTKLLITTRPTPEIENVIFDRNLCLDIQESDTQASVEAFVAEKLKILAAQRHLSHKAQNHIKNEVVARSGHIFQTAHTALIKLRAETHNLEDQEVVTTTLARITSKRMEDAYEESLEVLQAGPSENRIIASRILKILYFAQRPIGLPELENALKINVLALDTVEMAKGIGPIALEHFIRTKLGLLVKFGVSGNVQLQHQSVNDFLQGLSSQKWQDFSCANKKGGHLSMALICLGHLLLWVKNTVSAEEIAANEGDENIAKRSKAHFYTYASCWWETHGILADELVKPYMPLVNRLLHFMPSDSYNYFSPMMICRYNRNKHGLEKTDGTSALSPLAFMAERGFIEVLRSRLYEEKPKWAKNLTSFLSQKRFPRLIDILTSNINVNDQQPKYLSVTPLHAACRQGNYEVAQLLLMFGASGDVYDDADKDTPFSLAVSEGHSRVAQLLIESHEDYRQPLSRERPPCYQITLHSACHHGMTDIIRHLLRTEDDINIQAEEGWTAMHVAAAAGHTEVVAILLEAKADAQITSFHGYTPIFMAVGNNHLGVVKLLESKGHIDVTAAMTTSPRQTLLHQAASTNSIEVFEYLFEKSVVIKPDDDGYLPIHNAADSGNLRIFERLLNSNNFQALDKFHRTPLHRAARQGHLDIVKKLVVFGRPLGLDIDQRSMDTMGLEGEEIPLTITPLFLAASGGHRNVVQYLLEQRADVTVTSAYGCTLLHQIAESNDKELFELLLGQNLDPWAADEDNSTPLHTAADAGHVDIVVIYCRIKRKKEDLDMVSKSG